MIFTLCYILSCMSILAYESLQERRKENPTWIFYWKMKRLLCSDMCHPTEHTDRPTVLSNHPWQKEPLTLSCTGSMWRSSTACHRVQSCLCRLQEHFTVAARATAPGAREPGTSGSSITSVFSVVNTSKLPGNYSPEPSIKSISEEQILNIN